RGSALAQHTIVEYLDFECPFCARATGMWEDIHDHFRDRVRYVVRHLPLEHSHPRAMAAAIASEAAAEQGRFWEMHDLLFANQNRLEPEHLREYAKRIGLDMSRYDEASNDPGLVARVRAQEQGAFDSGARGTPTFFLNAERHRGPHDARTLVAALEGSPVA
ncbi:MAG: DsbA family protein, partial [Parahaliea sp.]